MFGLSAVGDEARGRMTSLKLMWLWFLHLMMMILEHWHLLERFEVYWGRQLD
jgi:hypothetical protein